MYSVQVFNVPAVSAAEVPDDAFLLDVREPDEWAAGHAPDAVHVPMYTVPERLDAIPADADVVVICRAGQRSAQVTAFLLQQGYRKVRNLDGGMYDWAAAGRPVVTVDGGRGEVI